MRTLAVMAAIALAIIAVIIHFSDYDFDLTPGIVAVSTPARVRGTPGTGSQADFTEVSTLLQRDMSHVPASLDAPGVPPSAAFNVKSRLAAAASTRKEYRTLAQACDLIIYADQEHSVRQSQTGLAQPSISGDLMANPREQQQRAATERTAIHAKAQADWEVYRHQTDQEVSRLLHSLQNTNP